jgi:basic membrane protein A and related proteins
MKHPLRAIAAIGVLATVTVACGSDDSGDEPATAAAAATTAVPASSEVTTATSAGGAAGETLRVGLVTDIGGLNDKGFNFLASEGMRLIASDLGAETEIRESKTDTDYVPNLSYFAQQGFDLVIAVGFLMQQPLGQVAGQFPDTKFAIIDGSVTSPDLAGHDNIAALSFHEEQGGYLNGYLAGLLEKEGTLPGLNPDLVVGTVGGIKIPAVDRYIAGFQAGATAAEPGVTTLNSYSNDFADQAKCKELAQAQIDQGADIVMQVAGGCGLGVFAAAEESQTYAMGGDTDQTQVAPVVVGAAQKKVDQAVLAVATSVQDGTYAGGTDTVLGVAEGGIEVAFGADIPQDMRDEVLAIQDRIRTGELTDIPTTLP